MKILSSCVGLVFALSLIFCNLTAGGETKMIEAGKKVKFDYVLTVDGNKVDSSEKTGPLEYVHGEKKIIPGLEKQMQGLKVGDKRNFIVFPEEGYGRIDPEAFKEYPKSSLPPEIEPKVGQVLGVKDQEGNKYPVVISEVKDETIVLNFNHPLAGKTLNFDITIVEIN